MREIDTLWEPARVFLVQIGEFLPRALVAIAIVLFLVAYVVPQVANVFAGSKRALPFLTVAMLAACATPNPGTSVSSTDGLVRHRCLSWRSDAVAQRPVALLGLPARVDLLERYIREYRADGFLIPSVKSCNSFSAGQLTILREVEERTGIPGGFLESDLVDARYRDVSANQN